LERPHKSAALPLALAYAALIVYASLYPFADWRDQGIAPWAYLSAPWPKYWTGSTSRSTWWATCPSAFFALAVLRTRAGAGVWRAVLRATAWRGGHRLCHGNAAELPARAHSFQRRPGAEHRGRRCGAVLAAGLERLGAVAHWSRARSQWFVEDARGGLVLLALWPFALLFPGGGHLRAGAGVRAAGSGHFRMAARHAFHRLAARAAVRAGAAGAGGRAAVRAAGRAGAVPAGLPGGALDGAAGRFAAADLAGRHGGVRLVRRPELRPDHAWAWLDLPVQVGLAAALLAGVLLLFAPRRLCAALLLVGLVLQLSLLNQAPESAYFAQTLATWEQGRFIRFHGLAQWLGWVWPFAVLGYVVAALSRRSRPAGNAAA
jgi:hypothetical protein